MSTLGIAIVGTGGITLQNHLPGLALCGDVAVRALCDANPATLAAAAQAVGGSPFTSTRWEDITRREDIQRLYVHPQTLAQCRGWIQKTFPQAELTETNSNARSAELAAKDRRSAACDIEFGEDVFGVRAQRVEAAGGAGVKDEERVAGRRARAHERHAAGKVGRHDDALVKGAPEQQRDVRPAGARQRRAARRRGVERGLHAGEVAAAVGKDAQRDVGGGGRGV